MEFNKFGEDSMRARDQYGNTPPPSYTAGTQNPANLNQYHVGYDQPGDFTQQQTANTTHHVVVTQPAQFVVAQIRPSDLVLPAFLACLCCFWPTGIAAIICASQSNSAADAGDYERAQRKHRVARNLIIASVVLGIVVAVAIPAITIAWYFAQVNNIASSAGSAFQDSFAKSPFKMDFD